jgi:hypothetical protein
MAIEQILIKQDKSAETIFQDIACPECDCVVEISYTDAGNQRLYCDNCDTFVAGNNFLHGINYCEPESEPETAENGRGSMTRPK